jgi:hypothetical protein
MRAAVLSVSLAYPSLRGRQFFTLPIPGQIGQSSVSVTPLNAQPHVAPAAATAPLSEGFDMPAVFGHVQDQVQDVNWGKFGIDTFNHAKQCIPHCVKYVLPKHEGKNLFHVAGKVGHCLLWECLPQAFRNAGKPGPFVADAMNVLQAQMASNARERDQQKRMEEEAARLKAINQIEEAELAHMEVELERAEHSEHIAWAVACICAVGAAGAAVFSVQRKGAAEALATDTLALVPA